MKKRGEKERNTSPVSIENKVYKEREIISN
jgi:hypothetical protein